MQSQWARLPGLRVPRHGPASSRQGSSCCGFRRRLSHWPRICKILAWLQTRGQMDGCQTIASSKFLQ